MKRFFIYVIIIYFGNSCGAVETSSESTEDVVKSITYRNNIEICDTCISALIVEHNECTECKDIYVLEGTVYVPGNVLKQFDSSIHLKGGRRKKLNTSDLYFEHSTDILMLWPDAENGGGFDKVFKLKGRVTGLRNNDLIFKIVSFDQR